MSGAYSKGTRVWFPDKEAGWISGEVTSKEVEGDTVKLTFTDEKGKETNLTCPLEKLNSTNDDLPPLRNPPLLESQEDLANLSNLNEPSVLHAISTRYALHLPYTYSGIVLIAINPFSPLSIYGPADIQAYSGRKKGELEPHLFAIAEEAMDCMRRGQGAGGDVNGTADQTIVVSGESGAGKTVSAKFILRYFATVDDPSKPATRRKTAPVKGIPAATGNNDDAMMSETERQILATNPIMEAFGNAKTTRNDNSSRFGKYIEILFDKEHEIVGARVRTYLLERSRLVYQPEVERNYHIFYQLCAGAPAKERKDLGLDVDTTKFFYLNQGGPSSTPINGVDDSKEFELTQKGLSTVGITIEKQWQIFRLLAALLHLGNVKITQSRNDAIIEDSDPALILATDLLGLSLAEFKKWTVKKQLVTRSEKIVTALNAAGATVVRDSVAKFVYACIWEYLVSVINDSLLGEGGSALEKAEKFIGVLDIYGFEHFKKNSLEQFFINYANEKLQQEFNAHVFKLEQEEYVREKINWTFIDFSDNQPCIDIIEGKLGVLSLLDEESRLPAGADSSFVTKLHTQLGQPQYKDVFKKPRFGGNTFTVAHYAVDVTYEAEGFIEKNRDTVPDEHLALLLASSNSFLKEAIEAALAPPAAAPSPAPKSEAPPSSAASKRSSVMMEPTSSRSGIMAISSSSASSLTVAKKAGGRKPTLGSIFKGSLISLMDTISHTNVHYIRCIKPNEAKAPWVWDAPQVLGQLRACGVLETIRISCAGYPSRWAFEDFAERYYMLVNSKVWKEGAIKELCSAILEATIHEEDRYQLGLTKLFFRAGMLAYLEGLRADRLNHLVTLVQKNIRRRLVRKQYVEKRAASVRIQAWWRGIQGRRLAKSMIRDAASIKIQKVARGWVQRKRYSEIRQSVVKIQSVMRGSRARSLFKERRIQSSAIKLQNLARGCLLRCQFKKDVRSVVHLQSCRRRVLAKKELKHLKAEARSVSRFKEISYTLENKVIELTQTLQKRTAEKKELQTKFTELEALQVAWAAKHEESEAKVRDLRTELKKPTVPLPQHEEILKSKTDLEAQLAESKALVGKHEAALSALSADIEKQSLVVEEQTKALEAASAKSVTEESTIAELKAELSNVRDQLNRANALQTLTRNAPAPNSPPMMSPSNGLKPLENGLEAARLGLGSSARHNRRHSSAGVLLGEVHGNGDRMMDMKKSQSATNRAVSVAYGQDSIPRIRDSNGLPTMYDDPSEEIIKMLINEERLDEDVLGSLIRGLKIPVPSLQNPSSVKEILFPAHLISLTTNEMWKYGLIAESERFLANVMQTIQHHVMGFHNEDAIVPGVFWLSNVQEILSFVCVAESDMLQGIGPGSDGAGREFEWSDYERLVNIVKHDLDSLEYNIYHTWMQETKKKLAKMVIPALVESQSLPGFITSDGSGRLFNRLLQTNSTPAYSMDDILNLLNKVWKALKGYFMEDSVVQQVVTEVLKLIGVTSFNDLLMRRNFCSWKRAMQIQYNITRLEEWCKSHEIPEGTLQLEHLMQATKLLQLKKASLPDIEIIYDVCWMLTPTQIQKLISNYYVADYENPISPEILKAVASRVVANDRNDHLLLPPEGEEAGPYQLPLPREIVGLETYCPAWLNAPHLRRLATFVASD